jgi:hypothetical protein
VRDVFDPDRVGHDEPGAARCQIQVMHHLRDPPATGTCLISTGAHLRYINDPSPQSGLEARNNA